MKRIYKFIILFLLYLPTTIYAYSNKIILGGENIGIEVNSNGVYIVGFYDVNNKNIAKESGFKVGDIIIKVNDQTISNIDSLNNIIYKEGEYKFTIKRENTEKNLTLSPIKENNILKTGLYVKDQINGIGTLSYIDPQTKIYGSLGHEIIENSSQQKFEIKDGNIYSSEVEDIKKSERGLTGEKKATINKNIIYGDIKMNEIEGIFGIYSKEIDSNNLIEVGKKDDIHKGEAYLRTVINNNEIKDFKISIISQDDYDQTKNILFEVTDQELLKETGGIVQGMSGSPIIQDNKIIGVVNYVIVEDTTKGYGIYITKMLEEGDKINS